MENTKEATISVMDPVQEFDTGPHPDKWTALLAFLDTSYKYAVKEKLLLTSYTPERARGKVRSWLGTR